MIALTGQEVSDDTRFDAIVSGFAAALYNILGIEKEIFPVWVMKRDDEGEPILSQGKGWHLGMLFQDSVIEELKDKPLSEIRNHFQHMHDREDILLALQYGLDPASEEVLRMQCIEGMEERFGNSKTLEFFETFMLSHPVPEAADFPGAIAICGSNEKVKALLENVLANAPRE